MELNAIVRELEDAKRMEAINKRLDTLEATMRELRELVDRVTEKIDIFTKEKEDSTETE